MVLTMLFIKIILDFGIKNFLKTMPAADSDKSEKKTVFVSNYGAKLTGCRLTYLLLTDSILDSSWDSKQYFFPTERHQTQTLWSHKSNKIIICKNKFLAVKSSSKVQLFFK